MTVDEINRRVQSLKDVVGDNEVFHVMEDEIHTDVLEAIAVGTIEGSPSDAAAAALRTLDYEVQRWYA